MTSMKRKIKDKSTEILLELDSKDTEWSSFDFSKEEKEEKIVSEAALDQLRINGYIKRDRNYFFQITPQGRAFLRQSPKSELLIFQENIVYFLNENIDKQISGNELNLFLCDDDEQKALEKRSDKKHTKNINDAVEKLYKHGLIDRRQTMGTSPYSFNSISSNYRTREAAERLADGDDLYQQTKSETNQNHYGHVIHVSDSPGATAAIAESGAYINISLMSKIEKDDFNTSIKAIENYIFEKRHEIENWRELLQMVEAMGALNIEGKDAKDIAKMHYDLIKKDKDIQKHPFWVWIDQIGYGVSGNIAFEILKISLATIAMGLS